MGPSLLLNATVATSSGFRTQTPDPGLDDLAAFHSSPADLSTNSHQQCIPRFGSARLCVYTTVKPFMKYLA
ncbi:hypothetical protein E2C01_047491 [Portunus trituberculatus]|uniref:Uncharacterized protein n=1 Tax=Portunus trituberculatus TaxID=210409 RepID=A0A5B7G187_PORTR|nr:hypothetical protein [Portunus trituberculatus]